MALEAAFPRGGICQIGNSGMQLNKKVISQLEDRTSYHEDYSGYLITGSRPEGLTMDDEWGHHEADLDLMKLQGGPLRVHVAGWQQKRWWSCLEFRPEACPAAYCKLQIKDLSGLRKHYKSKRWINSCVHRHGSLYWLNTYEAVRGMSLGTISGPAAQAGTGYDFVPTLVCNASHPDLHKEYQSRIRNWPSPSKISYLLQLPMLLVFVGHKLSPERKLQARVSWSHLELKLMQELPESVRQGNIACKYIIKRFLKAHRSQNVLNHFLPYIRGTTDGRSRVGSYHIKNTFLHYLEKTPPSLITSPFELFIGILLDLDEYLKARKLPQYFLKECDLLETVRDDELCLARQVISEILSDPLNAILTCPTYPQQIYGEVHPVDLVVAFSRVSSHPTCKQSKKELSELLTRLDERRRQRYIEQRERDDRKFNKVSGRAELIELVNWLKTMEYK